MRLRPRPSVIVALFAILPIRVEAVEPDRGVEAREQFARGMAALEEGRVDLARPAFAEAVELAPDWGLAHLQLGILEHSVDPTNPLALRCLTKASVLEPQNARAHYQLGMLYERLGRNEEAILSLTRATELRPQMLDAQFRLGNVLLTAGRASGVRSLPQTPLMSYSLKIRGSTIQAEALLTGALSS